MKTQSKYEYQPFEISGIEVRFHWDVQSFTVEDDPDLHWKAEEALCLVADTDEQIISKLEQENCSTDIQQLLLSAWNSR